MARIHVILPDDVLQEVDAVVGKRGRSDMITNALRRQLQWQRQEQALLRGAGAWKAEDHPEIETYDELHRRLRAEREAWGRRVADRPDPRP